MMDQGELKYDAKKLPVSRSGEKRVKHRLAKPRIDSKLCNSCMLCVAFCPENCITVKEGKPSIDYDFCNGCLICLRQCPKVAVIEEEKK